MSEFDDAPRYLYDIYDRCLAEGLAAYESGAGIDENPYAYQTSEWEFWREGYEP